MKILAFIAIQLIALQLCDSHTVPKDDPSTLMDELAAALAESKVDTHKFDNIFDEVIKQKELEKLALRKSDSDSSDDYTYYDLPRVIAPIRLELIRSDSKTPKNDGKFPLGISNTNYKKTWINIESPANQQIELQTIFRRGDETSASESSGEEFDSESIELPGLIGRIIKAFSIGHILDDSSIEIEYKYSTCGLNPSSDDSEDSEEDSEDNISKEIYKKKSTTKASNQKPSNKKVSEEEPLDKIEKMDSLEKEAIDDSNFEIPLIEINSMNSDEDIVADASVSLDSIEEKSSKILPPLVFPESTEKLDILENDISIADDMLSRNEIENFNEIESNQGNEPPTKIKQKIIPDDIISGGIVTKLRNIFNYIKSQFDF